MSNPPLTPFGSALAGALGACFSNAVVYPLDTVKTRLQALPSGGPSDSLPDSEGTHSKAARQGRPWSLRALRRWKMLDMLIRIIRTEGVSGTFKGFAANMINTFSMQFAYFFFHSLIRGNTISRLQKSNRSTKLSTSSELLLGAAAGALAQIFTIPVSVIATRQQLWTPETAGLAPSTGKNSNPPSLWQTGQEIVRESGVTGLWTGLRPGLVLTVNPAITYGVFERMKSAALSGKREGDRLGVAESFWIGVSSKAIATIVTYPYIFAKVRLQARTQPRAATTESVGATYAEIAAEPPAADGAVPDSEKQTTQVPRRTTEEGGAIPLLRTVYKERGFGGWYQGLTAQILKAALCQGILFVSKDQFEKWAWVIISLLTTVRKRLPLA
ncbi:putative adenine nucleotide transporter [Papiliotrema laurentii]|uniref:Adenine nucleotide transporter n=1 Tax=Papiliotrema laurentii TaxID=5418 RepID=A0AAD9CTN4_PAPLA|nr:putative adenine nucleotide transporter [Papiliotrema laurentii]